MLRGIIEDTYRRHTGAGKLPASDTTVKIETPVKEQVKWIFSEWDLNDDGQVTKAEFKDSLTALCDQMSPEDVEAVVEVVDKNKDGNVDVEEFLEWVFSGADHTEKVLAETAAPSPPEAAQVPVEDTAASAAPSPAPDAEAPKAGEPDATPLPTPPAEQPTEPPAEPPTEPPAPATAETAATHEPTSMSAATPSETVTKADAPGEPPVPTAAVPSLGCTRKLSVLSAWSAQAFSIIMHHSSQDHN